MDAILNKIKSECLQQRGRVNYKAGLRRIQSTFGSEIFKGNHRLFNLMLIWGICRAFIMITDQINNVSQHGEENSADFHLFILMNVARLTLKNFVDIYFNKLSLLTLLLSELSVWVHCCIHSCCLAGNLFFFNDPKPQIVTCLISRCLLRLLSFPSDSQKCSCAPTLEVLRMISSFFTSSNYDPSLGWI